MKRRSFWTLILALALAISSLPTRTAHARYYIVTNTNDSGTGSLRWAIQQANSNPGPDTITFKIASGCTPVCTIRPISQLPGLSGGDTTIDGYSQPGALPTAGFTPATLRIELDGSLAGNADGLVITSSGNTVKGLIINRFKKNGIAIYGHAVTGNVVAGNHIGTNAAGDDNDLGNGLNGVLISRAAGNTIGGDTSAARNVISANLENGIHVEHISVANVIARNYIGTNATGDRPLTNYRYWGIYLGSGAHRTLVGGDKAGQGNVIYGQGGGGVGVFGAQDVVISGNHIGADATGFWDVGDGGAGVHLGAGTQNALVGGDTPGERNLISGNVWGVVIEDADTSNNTVSGNYIGLGALGDTAIGNMDGIRITLGAHDNLIGGDTPGERNVISGNRFVGVQIFWEGTHNNTVSGNYIGTDAAGSGRIGNGEGGVSIGTRAQGNTIGGDAPGEGNVISGNGFGTLGAESKAGVAITGSETTSNTVSGNYIGTDASGTFALGNRLGVYVEGAGNTIGGNTAWERNVISGNNWEGIIISSGSGHVVSGNYIGVDATGAAPLGNGLEGVRVGAPETTVGGAAPEERNVISANGGDGVYVSGYPGVDRNTIAGNYIGVDARGEADLGNGGNGITIHSSDNLIGGTPNVISGNAGYGIFMSSGCGAWCWTAANNEIAGNLIGVNRRATARRGNDLSGVYIGGSGNKIGGGDTGAANTIAGNGLDGVEIADGSEDNVLVGNYVGTNRFGATVLGNARHGVSISGGSQHNTIQSNVVAHNLLFGVVVDGAAAEANLVTKSAIFGNPLGGIDLSGGANRDIPAPWIKQVLALPDGRTFTVIGKACVGCRVEIFANRDADSEGEVYLANTAVDASGAFTLTVFPPPAPFLYLTATASDAFDNTSEFSHGCAIP